LTPGISRFYHKDGKQPSFLFLEVVMITRIKLPLETHEFNALLEAAQRDLRPIDLQAKWFVIRALEERGFLPPQVERGEPDDRTPEKQ